MDLVIDSENMQALFIMLFKAYCAMHDVIGWPAQSVRFGLAKIEGEARCAFEFAIEPGVRLGVDLSPEDARGLQITMSEQLRNFRRPESG